MQITRLSPTDQNEVERLTTHKDNFQTITFQKMFIKAVKH